MADFVFLFAYASAWWLAWSSAVLAQRNAGHGNGRQHLMGFSHGLWFANVVGVLMVPPAAWWGYLLAGLALFSLWTLKDNLRAGRTLFDNGKPQESDKNAALPPENGSLFEAESLSAKPDKKKIAEARTEHDKAAAAMALQRAMHERRNKQPTEIASAADEQTALREFCRELIADEILEEDEARALHAWLQVHPTAATDGLAELLASHLDVVLVDDEITMEELFDLQDIVEAFVHDLPLKLGSWRVTPDERSSPRPKVKRRPKRQAKRRLEGGKLDTIHFNYRNAGGEFSLRQVIVRVVDDEYFEGFCLMRRAMRTFRLDRVQGDITSEESGEIAASFDWAAALADGSSGCQATPSVDNRSASSKEVMITGLPAAERARLEALAWDSGMVVRKSVTQYLDYLVAGSRAGPAKLEQATERGAEIITPEQLEAMVTANA